MEIVDISVNKFEYLFLACCGSFDQGLPNHPDSLNQGASRPFEKFPNESISNALTLHLV